MADPRTILRRVVAPVLLITLVLGGAWILFRRDTAPPPAGELLTVSRGSIRETADATGTIEPHVQVDLGSETSGELVEVLVAEGDTVSEGQLLFRIDREDAERALEEAQVALRGARADLAQARANLAVSEAEAEDADATRALNERSAERGLVSSETSRTARTSAAVAAATVLQRRAAVQGASANVASARLAVEDAEQRLEETDISSPMAGTVLDVPVEVGVIVASVTGNVNGGTTLATLADLSDLRVIGQIDEAQIGEVELDQEVEIRVDAYNDRTFAGHVARIAPLGVEDSNVVTFEVEVIVDDADRALLRSGMSADVAIIIGEEEGVLVPLTAVQSDGPRRQVQLASGEMRTIETGATDGRHIVVHEGLSEGDQIRATPGNQAAEAESSMGLFGPPGGGPPPGMG